MHPHLARPAERWGAAPAEAPLTVVAVHGRGQTPAFMREVADRVALPGLAWVAPSADDDSWYPLGFLAPLQDNEPRLSAALGVVARVRAQLLTEGVGPDRLALLGFSQGACLLSEHLVRTAEPSAAAVLLTGGHIGPDEPGAPPRTAPGDLGAMPVLLGSAEADPLVPVARVRDTARLLGEMGAAVELEVYDDLDHVVSDRAVASSRRVLQAALVRR